MSDLTQWNPNERLQIIANALRGTTEFLNKPGKLFGIGLGDLITGKSGDWVEDRAYGMPITEGTGFARQLTNKEGLLDTAFLPGVGALTGALRKGAPAVAKTAIDISKRDVLSNLGKGAVLIGTTAVSPNLVVNALKDIGKVVGKEAIPTISKGTATSLLELKALVRSKNALFHKSEDLGNAETWGEARQMFEPDELIAAGKEYFPNKTPEEILSIYNRMLDMEPATKAQKGTRTLDEFKHLDGPEFENEIMKKVITGEIEPSQFKPGTFDYLDYGATDYFDARNPLWGYIK